ncbi:protein S100-A4 [Platysternon megacephalum]|uniref:Protein S100-A4 n=1 Tax=Platysternon megacephalum TaxID=55544 RepID=A0A4D9DEP8_9SAUR|nr:tryptophanyl-tRNA synthetase [Platysternon megacephalum]TFJ99273.1 protein S100-A4 [Platysternon megacephalum]
MWLCRNFQGQTLAFTWEQLMALSRCVERRGEKLIHPDPSTALRNAESTSTFWRWLISASGEHSPGQRDNPMGSWWVRMKAAGSPWQQPGGDLPVTEALSAPLLLRMGERDPSPHM